LALGCYDNEWPPYASDVTFELYEDAAGKHWVKVRYCAKVRYDTIIVWKSLMWIQKLTVVCLI